MATALEVTKFLRPNGGYVQVGEEFEGITFESTCEPFTKAEYESAFAIVDQINIDKTNEAITKRQAALAKLEALGLDEDDLKALGF